MVKTYSQDPTELLDYEVTLVGGDTIVSATWTATPTCTIGSTINTTTIAKARISTLTIDTVYVISVHIVGTSGQEYTATFNVKGEIGGRQT